MIKVKKCIVMRSGSEFWISEEVANKLEKQLIEQTKHNFIKITEINRTINTADIVEVLTEEQVDERNRLKNKEWRCADMKWHEKGQKCFCFQEKAKKKKDDEWKREMEEARRELSPEEIQKRKKYFADTRKFLEDKGILAKKMSVEKLTL